MCFHIYWIIQEQNSEQAQIGENLRTLSFGWNILVIMQESVYRFEDARKLVCVVVQNLYFYKDFFGRPQKFITAKLHFWDHSQNID